MRIFLSGTPLEGENWTLLLNSKPFVYTVQQGDTLDTVVSALAMLIDASDDFSATADENTDSIAIASSVLFTASFVASGESDGDATMTGTTAAIGFDAALSESAWLTARIQLSGNLDTGAVWRVMLNGVEFKYTLKDSETLHDVAIGLVDEIDQNGDYSASVIGTAGTLEVSHSDTDPFTVEVTRAQTESDTGELPSGGSVDAGNSTASTTHWAKRVVVLGVSGAIVEETAWEITIGSDIDASNPTAEESTAYRYVTGSNREVTRPNSIDVRIIDNDTPGIVVTETNASTQLIEPSENVLMGSGFMSSTTSARIELTGTPATGETWAILLGFENTTYTVSQVVTTEDLAGMTTILRNKINDLSVSSLTASSPVSNVIKLAYSSIVSNEPFTLAFFVGNSPVDATEVKFVGDFGTSVFREVGIHDTVFTALDIDLAKWNTNIDSEIKDSTVLPHLTVLGTGDGNSDFYSFEITQDMLDAAQQAWIDAGSPGGVFKGIQAIFDIDHGFELGDSLFWVSWLKLYELKDPVDPEQPRLPTILAHGEYPNFSYRWDPGTGFYYDDNLEYYFDEAGVYYIEVDGYYPFEDGLPDGADYELNVSIEEHVEDTFLFAPEPVIEDEIEQGINGYQDLDPDSTLTPGENGDNFFTFYDPAVGNLEHGGGITSGVPYVSVVGSGDGSVDIYQFEISADMLVTDAGGLTSDATTQQDSNAFYTLVKYKLDGTVADGDVFTIGLRYENYTVTVGQGGVVATLESVANGLKTQIINDARYTAANVSVDTSGGVFLLVEDSRGFNLEGEAAVCSFLSKTAAVSTWKGKR